jgi:hypothetical protein
VPAKFVRPVARLALAKQTRKLAAWLEQYSGAEDVVLVFAKKYEAAARLSVNTHNGCELPRPLSVLFRATASAASRDRNCYRPSSWPRLEGTGSTRATPKLARDWAALMVLYLDAFGPMVESGEYERLTEGPYGPASEKISRELHRACGFQEVSP